MTNRPPIRQASPAHSSGEKLHRSAMTNDLLATRANGKTARGRRIRDLFRALRARLGAGPHDAVTEAHVLRVAELIVICEDLRSRSLAGDDVDVNDITRLEGTRDRAERALIEAAPADAAANAALDDILAEYRGAPDK